MPTLILAVAVAILLQGPGQAEKNAVMVPVRQFVDGFNTGDTRSALAACAEQTSIIDEFPPHEWHGPGACVRWMTDYDTDARKNGITDGIVTLGAPKHVDVAGDRAYVVIPSDYTFKRKGTPVKETASAFTFALQKTPAGWRITGWSWAKN